MNQGFVSELFRIHLQTAPCPPVRWVSDWFSKMLGLLFPETAETRFDDREEFERYINQVKTELVCILGEQCGHSGREYLDRADQFFLFLPELKRMLDMDAEAMFDGDPAASSRTEVVRSYPGFYAIAAHRMAHQLLKLRVNLVPRALAEYAHRITGIDINPGAIIGEHFCIDHGTGVVIGQTTVIGDRVKIYQGVTLGALSVSKEDATAKRHPTIEDDVVIYAGATILGGNTVVGRGSVIGGNVWLTRSVPPDTKVYYAAKMTNEEGEMDTVIMKG